MKAIKAVMKRVASALKVLFSRADVKDQDRFVGSYRVTSARDYLQSALTRIDHDIQEIQHDVEVHRDRFEHKLSQLDEVKALHADITQQLESM